MITERDRQILQALDRYGLLNRGMVQKLCFPTDHDGRVARRRLAALTTAGLIRRHSMLVASRFDGPLGPVYYIAKQGYDYLAQNDVESRFPLKPTKLPHPLHVRHALAVAEMHITLDAAIAAQDAVTLEAWFNEADVVNPSEPKPADHRRLFTSFDGSRRVCSPDAGFLLGCDGRDEAFYLEFERGSGDRGTGARQLAKRKTPGYAELARRQFHRRHFRTASDEFTVLLVAPSAERRDAIRRAFCKWDPVTYRTDLWRFASLADIDATTFLFGDVFYHCGDGSPGPLVRLGGHGQRSVSKRGGVSAALHPGVLKP
jgi:hypothetical protein